uniref:hypothetical protein n=1 Tax=Cyanobium sp. TaxID=2164130 RepID=UPI00404865DD
MPDQTNDQYAALERLYSERRWAEVEASADVLLAEIDGDLRSRVLLLLGHTRLYGFNDAGVAAEHYRQVLAAEPEALLAGIAQEGLNQCLAAKELSPAEEPSPADAMPWLEKIPDPKAAASGDSQPSQKSTDGRIQQFHGLTKPFQSHQNLSEPNIDNSEQKKIDKAVEKEDLDQDPTMTELKNFSRLSLEDQSELARGLLGVIIKVNSSS